MADDAELRDQVRELRRDLELVSRLVDAFGPTATQVIEAQVTSRDNARELERLRAELAASEDQVHESIRRVESRLEKAVDRVEKASMAAVARVEASCKSASDQLLAYSAGRSTSRATIIVGALGATATITAVILTKVLAG